MDIRSSSSYQAEKVPIDAYEAKLYLPYIATTITTHTSDPRWAAAVGYRIIKPAHLQEICHASGLEAREQCFFDSETSLKIVLMIKENSLFITFGAKDSYESEVEPDQQSAFHRRQLVQIAGNIFGYLPQAYLKAANFVALLKGEPCFSKLAVECLGQSFGGSLAQYVGLKHAIKTTVFNSLALGVGCQEDLGPKAISMAAEYVTHISVAGDFVSDSPLFSSIINACNIFNSTYPMTFGAGKIMPSAYSDHAHTHGYILGSLLKQAGLEKVDHPEDLQRIYKS